MSTLPSLPDLHLPDAVKLPDLGSIFSTGLENAIPGASAVSAVSSALGGDTLLSKITTANAIAIILGLILIAAGVFSFDKVQQTVGYAAKAAAV